MGGAFLQETDKEQWLCGRLSWAKPHRALGSQLCDLGPLQASTFTVGIWGSGSNGLADCLGSSTQKFESK